MAIIRGQSYSVTFYVWKKADLTPYTGSASAITVRISKDGGALATTTNAPTAVDTTNAPGAYRVLLTATEMDANVVDVFPSISDTSYQCEYVTLLTERGMIDAQVSSRAAPGDAMTLTTSERSSIASAVWSATTRTLTSFGTLVSDIWSHSTRTLTSFGSLVSDVANAVWSASTRTLTSFGSLANDVAQAVWAYTIEASESGLEWMRLIGSVLFGKRTYSNGNVIYRDYNDTKNRIVGTEDQDGNRTIISRDGS